MTALPVQDVPPEVASALHDLAGEDADVLSELLAALTPAHLRGDIPLPVTLPGTGPRSHHYRALLRSLSSGTTKALLLAATDPRHVTPELAGAEAAGLIRITVDGAVFVPPILQNVIYYGASAAQRQAAHTFLAARYADLLHRAAATPAPDDALAAELTAYAQRAPAGTAAAALHHAARLLLDAARHLSAPDALEAMLLAAEAPQRAQDQQRFAVAARHVLARAPQGISTTLLSGLVALSTGHQADGFRALRTVQKQALDLADPALLLRAAGAGVLTGNDHIAHALASRAAHLARRRGETTLVPQALETVATACLALGRHPDATAAAIEGAALATATGQQVRTHLGMLAVLAALAGDRDTTLARARQAGTTGGPIAWALSLLDLVEGRPGRGAERLIRVMAAAPPHAVLPIAATPHLIEAARRCDPTTLGAFERWTRATGQPCWLALRARCQALLAADPDDAEDLFREALGQHEREDGGYAQAHTQLLYGRHLRHHRRPGAAREPLRRAAETFTILGADPWAVQAGVELRASGAAPVRPEQPLIAGRLTAQQDRIARLVADGATNREIAQQLFLSPRTVDHHLRNVYALLGVRSRTELARHLLSSQGT